MAKPGKTSKQLFIIDRPSKTTLGPSKVRNVEPFTESLGLEGLTNDLINFTIALEKKPQKAITVLQEALKNTPEANKQWIMTWTDERGFDILQNCIISNKPDVIHFLLNTAQLFPITHVPKMNPYAHLAATLGHLECLQEVLKSRPDDYFKTSEPHHAVKLPLSILPPIKRTRPGASSKNLERLMAIIKQDTAIAEETVQDDNRSLMDEEFEIFKQSFKAKDSKPQKVYNPAQFSHSSQKAKHPEPRKVVADKQSLRPNKVKPIVKPKITVFWDVFKDDDGEGVIKGAGEPVETVYVHDKKHSHLSLERKDFVSYKKKTPPKVKIPKKQPDRQQSATRQNERKSTTSFITLDHRDSSSNESRGIKKSSSHNNLKKVEIGVRRIKKYKEFVPTLEPRKPLIDDPNKYVGKTPLTIAAEKGHVNCVHYLLTTFYHERKSSITINEPLTLATKARSPESLAVLLENKYSKHDFQAAVLMSIRELYPDCLAVLLNLGSKERGQLFDGTNLFHILYSQSLIANYRYEMLPEMTRILVNSKEEVNARYPFKTYPIYTLIQCAFNAAVGKQILNFLECLIMLLNANANPHFNEDRGGKLYNTLKLSRPSYTSAIQCVLLNAHLSLQYFEKSYWSQIIMQKFIEAIAAHDKTPRRVDNDILFIYMDFVSQLGLNRRILKILLRYGANPDYSIDGKYPLTMFFENMFAFLTKFQVNFKYATNDDVLDTLFILCRAMTPICLHEAVVHFLDNHLLSTPLQALDITRKFCYYVNKMITSPRSLTHIVSQSIWLHLRRNSNTVNLLPLPQDVIQQILP